MSAPLISVIITAFEQASSLELLLLSLVAQDLDQTFEVIICDDGSQPPLVQQSFQEDGSLDVRYVWQPKQGHRVARSKNNGIRLAKGKYLVFLDADIVIKPDFLRLHLAAHLETKLIVCNPRRWIFEPFRPMIDSRGGSQRSNLRDLLDYCETNAVEIDRQYQKQGFTSSAPWLACMGFSFSISHEPTVYFDENFVGWGPEDRELALRHVLRHGYSVKYHDRIEVFHLESCSTGRKRMNRQSKGTLLPTDHDAIVSFLKNMTYLTRQYSFDQLNGVVDVLFFYTLDEAADEWRYRPVKLDKGDQSRLRALTTQKVECIEAWLVSKGINC